MGEPVVGPRESYRYRLSDLAAEDDGPCLTIGQVAWVLGLSQELTRELADAGDIRAVRIGRNRRIAWRSFRLYLFTTGVLPLLPAEMTQPQPFPVSARQEVDRLERRVHRLEWEVGRLRQELASDQAPTISATVGTPTAHGHPGDRIIAPGAGTPP